MTKYFIVRLDNEVYANSALCTLALADGERSFMRLLAEGKVSSRMLFDQTLYKLTGEQEELCRKFSPAEQDFDFAIRHFNLISKDEINLVRGGTSERFPGAAVIDIHRGMVPEFFMYWKFAFFPVRYFRDKNDKYRMVSLMATVKLCGFLYTAIDAVDARVETPIIATLRD